MTEYHCPHCDSSVFLQDDEFKKPDDVNHDRPMVKRYRAMCLNTSRFDNGCHASGPYRETPEAALEAFCNPAKRIAELESALRELLSQPQANLALVPAHERGCSAWIDRATIEEAIKALRNESEEKL